MDRKKLYVILIILFFAILVSGILLKTRKTEQAEPKPAENVLVEEEVIVESSEDNQVNNETKSADISEEKNKGQTKVKLYKKSVSKPAAKPQTENKDVQEVSVEKTDINPELLKQEPRADVVVVDKEYKIRRIGKYIFR